MPSSPSVRRASSPAGRLHHHHHRNSPSSLRRVLLRPHHPWRSPLLRLLACFLLGSILGLSQPRHPLPSPLSFPSDPGASDPPPPARAASRVIETVRAVNLHARLPAENLLIVVTPTYNRAVQAYYLTRLGQTLRLVNPPLLWIVVEVGAASSETAELLRGSGVMYRHLVCPKDSGNVKDRGVLQRNTALEHIERHQMEGVVYFADDDNMYSVEMFEASRVIRRFGTWPVAMLAQCKSRTIMEGPVCNGSKVVGWHTNEKSKRLRRFHVDMSGFAFNSTILWDHRHWRHRSTSRPIRQLDTVKEGFQETTFIEQVVEDESQMEAVPSDCSKIMNWHLHLDARALTYPRGWRLLQNLEAVIHLP